MVLQRGLKVSIDVINLSVAGYGLTQEIRRYYEFGQLFLPSYVILEFVKMTPRTTLTTGSPSSITAGLYSKKLSGSL